MGGGWGVVSKKFNERNYLACSDFVELWFLDQDFFRSFSKEGC